MEQAWADVKQFLLAARFARPGWLWLCLAPALLSVAGTFASRRATRRRLLLGRPGLIAGLVTHPFPTGFLRRTPFYFAWLALVIGLAGPRWGAGDADGVAVGRDVVLLLDFSRSMWAEDMADPSAPARWQAAVAGCRDLVRTLRPLGGHRVGVVVFAARPVTVAPLTTDFDHVDQVLADLDGRAPPAGVRPTDDSASGTRLGAGIAAAVQSRDPRFPNAFDVILLTDADDPSDDGEWQRGVTAARAANAAVHVVGVGDPDRDTVLLLADAGVPTRLRGETAARIAAGCRGEYLPANRGTPALGEFFRAKIHPRPPRELLDDPLPGLRDRSAWFLVLAAVLFAVPWVLTKRGT